MKPELLEWACERNAFPVDAYADRFNHLRDWVTGKAQPTLKQLKAFAKATYTPIGYFFLETPPVETVPIPDYRTKAKGRNLRPSPNLLDTIYLCQQRQDWYREFVQISGGTPLEFVGSAHVTDDVAAAAKRIRQTLQFELARRAEFKTWEEALRYFIGQAEDAGLLVMCTSIVHTNSHRHLDPEEFSGFALVDPMASVIFINGADSKSAQMFTLAHELAHVWLGQTGVTDSMTLDKGAHDVERWCDAVAAELLVPMVDLKRHFDSRVEPLGQVKALTKRYKVSTLVVLRRLKDLGVLKGSQFWAAFNAERARLSVKPEGSGGDFYATLPIRVSRRFAQSIIASTWEGRSSFTEAFRLLGVSKMPAFRQLSENFGMSL